MRQQHSATSNSPAPDYLSDTQIRLSRNIRFSPVRQCATFYLGMMSLSTKRTAMPSSISTTSIKTTTTSTITTSTTFASGAWRN